MVAVCADCHLSVAVDRFAGTGLHHLVVVDRDGRAAGLLTHERVAAALARAAPAPSDSGPRRRRGGGVVLAPLASARQAARLMLDQNVRALPVVRGDGVLVGVLSWTDLVALLARG